MTSISGWPDISSMTSSRIKRGRAATSTLIFSTVRTSGRASIERKKANKKALLRAAKSTYYECERGTLLVLITIERQIGFHVHNGLGEAFPLSNSQQKETIGFDYAQAQGVLNLEQIAVIIQLGNRHRGMTRFDSFPRVIACPGKRLA
jgi:hypothetical protein